MLEVKILNSAEDLEKTARNYVRHALWGTENLPETYAYFGFVMHDGFYLKMVCKEKNPIRKYTKNQDTIWFDSAMEIFLQLPCESGIYVNFEANANGAILAQYGPERKNRSLFMEEYVEKLQCQAKMEEDGWSVWFKIPQEVLETVYGPLELKAGSEFRCNFYKVCEGSDPCQFGSYTHIPVEEPSFHLPEYFAEAVLK